MFSRNFKETNEDRENVDNKVDNIEKPRNQILAVREKYNDDFDKKLDEKEKNDGNDGMKSNGFFSKMRERYSKTEESFEKTEDSDNKNNKTEERKSWELTPEQKEKYKAGEKRIIDDYQNGKFDKKVDKNNESNEDGDEKQHGDGGERVPWER